MQSGALDRLVTWQRLVPTTNVTGEFVNGWVDFATVWASKKETPDTKSKEDFEAVMLTEQLATMWQMRYLPGVNTKMRIICEGETYEVKNIGEIPRRRGWLVTSERRESETEDGGTIPDPTDTMATLTALPVKTANYTALLSDAFKIIPFDCTLEELSCTLPAPDLTAGMVFRPVKLNVTGQGLRIVVAGGGLINLGEGLFINNQQDAVPLLSDGSKYIAFGG